MQSMLHLTSSYGLPLCVSAISPPLALSKEMEDHDRRRKALRKQRSRARLRAVPELALWREDEITAVQAIVEGEVDGDLADLFRDLLLSHYCNSSFPAKAA